MTPETFLDLLIPRWQSTLPERFTPDIVAGFVKRNRAALLQVVAQVMRGHRLTHGALPQDEEDFQVFDKLVARGRTKDRAPDRQIAMSLLKRLDEVSTKVAREQQMAEFGAQQAQAMAFIQLRAVAVYLRERGIDAVPLLTHVPSLAVAEEDQTLFVDVADGTRHVRPGAAPERIAALTSQVDTARSFVAQIRVADGGRLDRYATTLWSWARSAGAPRGPSPAPPGVQLTQLNDGRWVATDQWREHYQRTKEAAAAKKPIPTADYRTFDPPSKTRPGAEETRPPDLRTAKWRTEANVAAIRLVAAKDPSDMTPDDHAVLERYSGWGGLSRERVKSTLPPDLVPETFGLIHEYYTPSAIADAIVETLCPLLPELAGNDGVIRALEPSAGVGRLIRAFTAERCLALEVGGQVKRIVWTAIEYSKVSGALLRALRPDVELFNMPFERWIRNESSKVRGTVALIVSNPPYGERGAMAREDPDEFYKEKRAYAYFMRRALDLLIPGGVGVFLIPAGFLSGAVNRALREKILRRHHLLGAFRLPSHDTDGRETVPGASVVMDVVFWRSRGGELSEVDIADLPILEGDYFAENPKHVLGKAEGAFAGDEETGATKTWRFRVTGDFIGLPRLDPRPVCTACVLSTIVERDTPTFQTVVRGDDVIPKDTDEALRPALELGRRVGRYLATLGADEAERASQLWPELHVALTDYERVAGNPWRNKPLRALADKGKLAAAEQLLSVFERGGGLTSALREPPQIEPKYTGQPDDILGQAELLFRQRRALTLDALMKFHQRQGGTLARDDATNALLGAGWNLDGPKWDELWPADAYLTGNELWARYDRALARGDEQAKLQARRLLDAIQPAIFEDLSDVSPQHGYVPLALVSEWITDTLNGRYGRIELERSKGFVQPRGFDYATADEFPALSPDTLAFLGYVNHDPELFRPPAPTKEKRTREERLEDKQSLAQRRMALAQKWDESFRAWVGADAKRRERLTDAYNRSARGRIVPTFPPEPLEIARWGPMAPKLKSHQIAGARRVLAQRGGLVAFDVGVGKTYTALAIIARARQEGWVRRPVILVPASLVWKWHDDVLCTLPDYRVAVIGSKRKRVSRGVRSGALTSEPDTPQERASKWIALQSGQLDVVILSYDALARTRMNDDAVLTYVEQVEAISRSIALRRRNLQEKVKTAKQEQQLSERERALLEHGARAWVEEILSLPNNWEYDPGITWDEIGVDMLVVDEAAAFKNLYKPQAREDGVPKFMGGGGEGSDRAWQLDFRAAAVRQKTGGAGIVLLTATPAKNSPLEFYNLIQFIDPAAFTRAGIHDSEQFIDRFLKIEIREVLDTNFDVADKSACVGFQALEDLRTLIFTYAEFRTADEVGLQLPKPVIETITITMDDEQERKYERYVSQIEDLLNNPNPAGSGNAMLGLLARLSLVALHGALDEGYSFKTALDGGIITRKVYDAETGESKEVRRQLGRPTYESPKLVECAKRVAASPHCGHIIFCEPTAVHAWMREVLVAHKIPRERIAILNAEETTPQDRLRIAREFNGLSSEPPPPGTCVRPTDSKVAPKYDVVIANSVAYEGIDLQVRTCTIHHLDLPWTPADLEQRNGRAVRQGNTLATVQIFYYFADRSTDGYRFSLIDGKAGWLGQLIRSQVRDTNNPAAQQQLTPEDILLMISRNKDKTRERLQQKRERQAAEARARIAREASRLLRQAAARFRDARITSDAEKAARLREEGELRLADLERVAADAWPWAPWMYAARDVEMIIPESGAAPVYEGLRVVLPRPGAPGEFDFVEFGQVVSTDKGSQIGLRAAGSPRWELLTYTGTIRGLAIEPSHLPREGGPAWPDDDDPRTQPAIERNISERLGSGTLIESLGWRGASDAFVEKWWARLLDKIDRQLANPAGGAREGVPVVQADGRLALITNDKLAPLLYNDRASLVPPTRVGWQQFLALAPASAEPFMKLKAVATQWFGRSIPANLLSTEREAAAGLAPPSDAAEKVDEQVVAVSGPAGRAPPSSPLEEARLALEGLQLPRPAVKRWLGRVEKALQEGKSPAPILAQAFKEVAEGESKKRAELKKLGPTKPQLDIILDSFNAEPRWRLVRRESRPSGWLFVVVPEGKTEPVAAVDVVELNVEDIRWLDERVGRIQQTEIESRLERALWAAYSVDVDADEDELPRPLDELIALMKRRSEGLPVPYVNTPDSPPTDDYSKVALALADLTTNSRWITADELEGWLVSEGLPDAANVVGRGRGSTLSVEKFMQVLWAATAIKTSAVISHRGELWVPASAIFRLNKGQARVFVLTRVERRRSYFAEKVQVEVLPLDSNDPNDTPPPQGRDLIRVRPRFSGEQLSVNSTVHLNSQPGEFYTALYEKYAMYQEALERAPAALAEVRTLLYWTGVMLEAPRCQGETKVRATRAFLEAKRYFDIARDSLIEGRTHEAVHRIQEAMQRIGAAAAEISRSCAEGQIDLVAPVVDLPVDPLDIAALTTTEGGQ